MTDFYVCSKCEPNRYVKSCRRRWWRRAKCRYKPPIYWRVAPEGFGCLNDGTIDGAVVERRANRAMKRLLDRYAEAKR